MAISSRVSLLDGDYKYPVYTVKRFKEKPDQETAEQMIRSGDHSWNSGMFVWRADAILAEIEETDAGAFRSRRVRSQVPGTHLNRNRFCRHIGRGSKSQTIDYGIMEKAEQVAVLPAGGLGLERCRFLGFTCLKYCCPDYEWKCTCERCSILPLDTHNTLDL